MTKIQLTLIGIVGLSALLGTVSAGAATIRIKGVPDNIDYCLDPKGNSAYGSVVVLRECGLLQQDQQWSLHGGVIESKVNNNTCLDVINAQAIMGTYVQIYNCNGNIAQKWTYDKGTLRSFGGSHLCLDVPGANFYDGAPVWIWECNGLWAQDWRIE